MSSPSPSTERSDRGKGFNALRRAMSEFLGLPLAIIAGSIVLALLVSWLDRTPIGFLGRPRSFMERNVFGSPGATSEVLGGIAGGLITVTSITLALILLSLQQGAASLTAAVLDQFLRRRANQFYAGYFVGLAAFSLITLATVSPSINPVYGGTIALSLTVVSFVLLIVLIYTTVNQMRPAVIIGSIHDMVVAGRQRQQAFLDRTRRSSTAIGRGSRAPEGLSVGCHSTGYVVSINLDRVQLALDDQADAEISLRVSIGSFVAFGDDVASIRPAPGADATALVDAVRDAIVLDRSRDLRGDPAYGIDQLEAMAWTSISTSKQNPAAGILVIDVLRDLVARWLTDDSTRPADDGAEEHRLPILYHDDVEVRALGALESITIVASESMQHQVFSAALRTISQLASRLTPDARARAEQIVLRSLTGLGDHVLSMELEDALEGCASALAETDGDQSTAAAIRRAVGSLRVDIGTLQSRSTRVGGSG